MTRGRMFAAVVVSALFTGVPAARADVEVSPGGSKAVAGSSETVFPSLEAARDRVRALKAAGKIPKGGLTVRLHGGDYLLNGPFELTSADSGTADSPIVYRAVEGERPRIVNARRIPAGAFKPVSDPQTLARIAEPLRGKLLELDLAALGVKHAQSPPDVFMGGGGLLDLYIGGRRMPLARFPNDTNMTMKRVLDTGGGSQGNWRQPGKGAAPAPDHGGTFEYRDEFAPQFEAWQRVLDRGVWLRGYWRVMWENEAIRVQSIDPAKHTVTFARPIPGGIGNKYHRPEGNGQEQYWAFNLLEEIDRTGEWCVDFKDHKLYLYPPASLEGAEILLADSDGATIHLSGASHVLIANVLVEAGLGDGIRVDGGEGDTIAGCTIRNVDRNGIVFNGGSHHVAQSCDLYNLGAGGIWLGGGDEKSSPRVPAAHQAINNHIHDFAQIDRVYAAGINCGFTGGGGGGHHPAVGMLVAHNLVHDTPHVGVLFGSWDSVFEYNEVFRYATVSNDIGAFYCYDKFEQMGNQTFRYNLIHDSDDGDGIYFDHDHRDVHIYGNVVALKSFGGRRGTGFLYKIGSQAKNPQGIECYNNIALQCNIGFAFVSALPGQVKIRDNVSVMCRTPWTWRVVKDGKEAPAPPAGYASGKNAAYDADPGFVDAARLDFRLKPGAQLLKDLPGFQPIPVEKIGLYTDAYRKALPTGDEIDRLGKRTVHNTSGYQVEDRK